MSGGAPVVGVDLGGTNMQIGVVDAEGRVVADYRCRTNADRGVDAVIESMANGIREACTAAGTSVEELGGVGIAAPGAIDIPRAVVIQAPNLGWEQVPLGEIFEQRLGRPVTVDNDVNAAAWGEFRLGAGRGADSVLGIWVGTGVGGGLVLGGRLHHGPLFTAGEVGHTVIEPDAASPSRTVEDLCSRSGMQRIVAERLAGHRGSMLEGPQPVDTVRLAAAYAARDGLAVEVIDRAADLLGVAIANWVTVLALDRVLVGGGMVETLGQPFVDRIRRSFQASVFPPEHGEACGIAVTQLRNNAGLLGAALLARERAGVR